MRLETIKKAISEISGLSLSDFSISEDLFLTFENKTFPLAPWRFDRRLMAMRTLAVEDCVLRQVCSYKSVRISNCSENIENAIRTELDVLEWMLDDKITSVYAVANSDRTMSIILQTQKNVLCNIEIALTLSDDTRPITRHEMVGIEGMISDRSINEQVPFEAVYLFNKDKKNPETYTDMEAYLFGLDPFEVAVAENVLDIVTNPGSAKTKCLNLDRIKYLSACVYESAAKGQKIKTEVTAL